MDYLDPEYLEENYEEIEVEHDELADRADDYNDEEKLSDE